MTAPFAHYALRYAPSHPWAAPVRLVLTDPAAPPRLRAIVAPLTRGDRLTWDPTTLDDPAALRIHTRDWGPAATYPLPADPAAHGDLAAALSACRDAPATSADLLALISSTLTADLALIGLDGVTCTPIAAAAPFGALAVAASNMRPAARSTVRRAPRARPHSRADWI